MTSSPAELVYDPLDLATHCDPYPTYRRLRAERPLYWNPDRKFWALSRRDDVARAGLDWRRFASSMASERSDLDRCLGIRSVDYIAADSTRHAAMRRLLRPDFTANAIGRLEERVRAIAIDLVDRVADRGHADFVDALAEPLPARVLCDLLGLPQRDAESIRRWNRDLWRRTPGDPTVPDVVLAAERAAREHVEASIGHCSGGVLKTLREAERAQVIDRDEMLDTGVLLIAAGMKTTSALIATILQLLAQHPDQQRLLAGDRRMTPGAVEEALRFDSPSQWFARIATDDVETEHGTIPAGDRVLLLFGSANRDERAYDDPGRFDILRSQRPHLSFGHGIHHCIAASLARLEARIALDVVMSRLRDIEVAGEARREYTPAERDLASLPLAFGRPMSPL